MLRIGAFFAALLLYASFSAPTPDQIGIAEGLVFIGLLAGMGAAGVMQAAGFRYDEVAPRWLLPARALLIFGLSVPLIVGIAQGHGAALMLRDVIPFLFLLLPLFFTSFFLRQPVVARLFPYALCLMGFIFVLRVLGSVVLQIKAGQFAPGFMPDPANLVNAPTVLFAALFLTGIGGLKLIDAKTPLQALIALGCFALTLLLLAGMAGVGQRAYIGAWGLTVIFWLGLLAVTRPLMLRRVALLLLVAALLLWPVAAEIVQGLAHKTSAVGLNNRWEEAQAVWNSFQGRPWALIFGQGWGAGIVSPAVGPDPVNYTHSLPTTYLLKGGLLGLALVLTYLWALAAGLWRVLWVHPVAAAALAAPFLIDILLYASFKSLDFGLLLVLLALWTRSLPARR